jgi:hypothetical protein
MSSNPYSNFDIFFFLIATYFYYQYFKTELTYSDTKEKGKYQTYLSNSNIAICVYITFIILSQSIVNSLYKSYNCGGKASEVFLKVTWITLAYWIFIFGIMMVVLIMKPSLKKPFSDVFGYYWVSYSANTLITELLVATDVEATMKKEGQGQPLTEDQKTVMQQTADAIIKICGNSDILINKITPLNFDELWDMLTPLMKDAYKTDNQTEMLGPDKKPVLDDEGKSIKVNLREKYRGDLFKLVVSKDTIGEMVWYVYTGITTISFIKLMISSMKCQNSPETIEKNNEAIEEAQKKADEKREKLESKTYTL